MIAAWTSGVNRDIRDVHFRTAVNKKIEVKVLLQPSIKNLIKKIAGIKLTLLQLTISKLLQLPIFNTKIVKS